MSAARAAASLAAAVATDAAVGCARSSDRTAGIASERASEWMGGTGTEGEGRGCGCQSVLVFVGSDERLVGRWAMRMGFLWTIGASPRRAARHRPTKQHVNNTET